MINRYNDFHNPDTGHIDNDMILNSDKTLHDSNGISHDPDTK